MKLTGKKKITVETNAAVLLRVAGTALTLTALALNAIATRQARQEEN
jgi:hypothetical protein